MCNFMKVPNIERRKVYFPKTAHTSITFSNHNPALNELRSTEVIYLSIFCGNCINWHKLPYPAEAAMVFPTFAV